MSSLLHLISTLRQKTQLPLKDCKEALIATNYNIDQAMTWLQQKYSQSFHKNNPCTDANDQEASILAIAIDQVHKSASLAKLKCKTSFAANTDIAKEFLALTVCQPFAQASDYEHRHSLLANQLKEEIDIKTLMIKASNQNEFFFAYCHPPLSLTDKVLMGQSMTLVGLINKSSNLSPSNKEISIGYKIAQHFHAFQSDMNVPFLFQNNHSIGSILDRNCMELSRIIRDFQVQ